MRRKWQMGCDDKKPSENTHLKDGKGLESGINRRKLVGYWQSVSTSGSYPHR